jgi:PDGLE domain-containing protein
MRWFTILALALAVGLATAVSPLASSAPDGLTRVAADKGFAAHGRMPRTALIDYRAALGGFAGTLIVFAAGYGIARAVRR